MEVKNSKIKLRKILLILAYAVYVIVHFAIGSIVKLIIPLLALVPVTTWILVWLTWRYAQLSYEYSFYQGAITVNRCFGSRTKKAIANVKIKNITEVIRCNGNESEKLRDVDARNVVFAASSNDALDLTLVLYTSDTNEKMALYFETNEKAIKIMKYYNSNLTI